MASPLCRVYRVSVHGVRVAPCPRQALVEVVGQCGRGHKRRRRVCQDHADTFAQPDADVSCFQCGSSGVDNDLTVTVIHHTGAAK